MKATIDLDWLNSEIKKEVEYLKGYCTENERLMVESSVTTLTLVRSKCTPIQEPYISITNNSHCRISKKYKNE